MPNSDQNHPVGAPHQPPPPAPVAIVTPGEDDYQPTAKTLRLFLWTQKCGPLEALPGLIGTHGHAMMFFGIALVAELWGLACLYAVAGISPVFVLLLFILDLGAALMAHVTAKGKCLQRNYKLFYRGAGRGTPDDRKINKLVGLFVRLISGVGCVLIIVLALGKGMAVQHFKDNLSDEAQGPIFLTTIAAYVVAALVHLRYTGYAVFEIIRLAHWHSEKSKYVTRGVDENDHNVPGWPQRNVRRFTAPVALQEINFGPNNRHQLRHIDGAGGNDYELRTISTLTDADVIDLCTQVANGIMDAAHKRMAHDVLCRECVTMQFTTFMGMADPSTALQPAQDAAPAVAVAGQHPPPPQT